jgi:anionic cell wall polymer biosynthesis LytR-Cps2A-Psr (LCP) family protein
LKKKIAIAFIIVSVIVLTALGVYYYQIRTRNAVEVLSKDKKLINVLVAGSNTYRQRKHRFFSIITVNPENANVGITFIPPDFKVVLDPDTGEATRIDEVDFIYFDRLRKSLQRDLKLSIPFYVELYSTDVKRIVDLLEGVDLFLLDEDEMLPDTSFGLNYFDGNKILHYINSVEENSIYLKFDRIQNILLTLYNDREEKKHFLSLPFITELMRDVKTNMLPQEILSLGSFFTRKGAFFCSLLPGGFHNDYYVVNDINYKIYETELLTPLIMGRKNDPAIKVKILNGTNVSGLARKMRNSLNRDGLSVVEFGTSPYEKMHRSIIISRKGNIQAVKQVSELTGISRVHYIIDNTTLQDILIIIGEDQAQ